MAVPSRLLGAGCGANGRASALWARRAASCGSREVAQSELAARRGHPRAPLLPGGAPAALSGSGPSEIPRMNDPPGGLGCWGHTAASAAAGRKGAVARQGRRAALGAACVSAMLPAQLVVALQGSGIRCNTAQQQRRCCRLAGPHRRRRVPHLQCGYPAFKQWRPPKAATCGVALPVRASMRITWLGHNA